MVDTNCSLGTKRSLIGVPIASEFYNIEKTILKTLILRSISCTNLPFSSVINRAHVSSIDISGRPLEASVCADGNAHIYASRGHRRRAHACTHCDVHGQHTNNPPSGTLSQSSERGRDSPLASEPFFCRQTDQAFCETWIDHKKRDSLFA